MNLFRRLVGKQVERRDRRAPVEDNAKDMVDICARCQMEHFLRVDELNRKLTFLRHQIGQRQ